MDGRARVVLRRPRRTSCRRLVVGSSRGVSWSRARRGLMLLRTPMEACVSEREGRGREGVARGGRGAREGAARARTHDGMRHARRPLAQTDASLPPLPPLRSPSVLPWRFVSKVTACLWIRSKYIVIELQRCFGQGAAEYPTRGGRTRRSCTRARCGSLPRRRGEAFSDRLGLPRHPRSATSRTMGSRPGTGRPV